MVSCAGEEQHEIRFQLSHEFRFQFQGLHGHRFIAMEINVIDTAKAGGILILLADGLSEDVARDVETTFGQLIFRHG